MSEEEKQIQSLVLELRLLESYLGELSNRESLAARALLENRVALQALKALPEKDHSEILVPLGGGLLLNTRAPPVEKLIVGVGASVAVEKTREEARVFVEERLQELENALKALQSERLESTRRLNATRAAINSIVQKQRQG